MGYLFKIFLIAVGVYYLFKLLTKKKTPMDNNSSNTQFTKDPSRPSQKTDNSVKGEGEYVDYEEVD
jgi:hypothetical protein